jgi:hypothetical protein
VGVAVEFMNINCPLLIVMLVVNTGDLAPVPIVNDVVDVMLTLPDIAAFISADIPSDHPKKLIEFALKFSSDPLLDGFVGGTVITI